MALGVLAGTDSIVHVRRFQSPFFHRVFQKQITAILQSRWTVAASCFSTPSVLKRPWPTLLHLTGNVPIKWEEKALMKDSSWEKGCYHEHRNKQNIWMLLRKLGAAHYSNSKQSTEGKEIIGCQSQTTTKNFSQIIVVPALFSWFLAWDVLVGDTVKIHTCDCDLTIVEDSSNNKMKRR